MKLALDTNRYVDLMLPISEVVQKVEAATEVILPFAVLAELSAGFINGTRRAHNERILSAFLARPFVHPLYPDERTVAAYAAISAELHLRGRMIPQNDIWIAALCVQHGLTLYTRDRHFDQLPQLAKA